MTVGTFQSAILPGIDRAVGIEGDAVLGARRNLRNPHVAQGLNLLWDGLVACVAGGVTNFEVSL